MQWRSLPFWFRIVSIARAVFPVWRSPMISSRWPRPIGIIESIALRPVCGLVHRPAVHDARSATFQRARFVGHDGSLAVDRLADRVHDPAGPGGAHGGRGDTN